ncbi:MAG: AttH component of AttEFGH ABC transport system [uncultured Thermomicrobiales bacterium]|uniref:AttH component of AttEFGH ABC transport system n=1 Tax=uncultured Thermomicrobiales bacterium TaxID=1645740 RepID=A0A6J4TXS4_9BACT|nr:MAG: AttH component of AttEFGH ABC transport system [uncultured Thermomicrobiales bacterium]
MLAIPRRLPAVSRPIAAAVAAVLAVQVALGAVAAQEASPVASPYVEPPPGVNDAPVPVEFPRDDGPHDAAIEWWYYTGHLFTADGSRFGFEQVVFKGQSTGLTGYASHVAITDAAAERFSYDQKLVGEAGVSTAAVGFDLNVGGWLMRGANGDDRLRADVGDYAYALALTAEKPATLHDGDGFIDYGNGQGSYYYSRTRMAVDGTLVVAGQSLAVTGEAWMDHQWGDFDTFAEGGWDWFSVQLDDGTDLMLYLINAPDGTPVILDGSLVDRDGSLTILDGPDFSVEPTTNWTSPETGVTYPSGWEIALPDEDLALTLTPTVADQELDTTRTTGVIYWEGEVTVEGVRAGEPVGGLGYVELTGYAERTRGGE